MTERRIAYALICLVGTYLFSCLHELCWLETQSFEIAVLRNGHLKIAKLGNGTWLLRQSASVERVGFRASDFAERW